jgi:undecaprenyl-diphosphatase
LAQAAPTPGGIGAAEAALIAGLTAFGVDPAVAVPAVFLYRFATFWLPVLPGWIAVRHLLRTGAL